MSQNSPSPDTSRGQSLPAGTHLEEFVIERVLGVGGFGITYLAKDSSLGRQVVIKENLPAQFCWRDTHALTVRPRHKEGEDADNFQYSMESFRKEASTLASLDHPGIVKVLRSFQAHGTAYFVMPFVEGIALDEVIRQRTSQANPLTEAEIQDLLTKVLDALGYLHERGIYHRDIKPGNLLMTKAGPVLIDFGAARQRLSERSLTVIESAGYTPFEQLQSRGKIGPWSDLYALGATLYKAITGETPAKATDRAFDDPEVPLAQRDDLRERYAYALLASIDKAMSPKAADRFQDASQWFEQISPPQRPGSLPPPIPSRTTQPATQPVSLKRPNDPPATQPATPSTTKSSAPADGNRRSKQQSSDKVDFESLRQELKGGYAWTIFGDATLTFIQTTTLLYCASNLYALTLAIALWSTIVSILGIRLARWLRKPSLFMSFIVCAIPIIGMIRIIRYHREAREILALERAQDQFQKVQPTT
jgi:serine/threonine protein kinase